MRYKDGTAEDWKRVVRVYGLVSIRVAGERLNPKYVKKIFKSAQLEVIVWACFTGEKLGCFDCLR